MKKSNETRVVDFLSDKSGLTAIAYALIAAFAMTAVIGCLGLLMVSLGTGQAELPSISGLFGIF